MNPQPNQANDSENSLSGTPQTDNTQAQAPQDTPSVGPTSVQQDSQPTTVSEPQPTLSDQQPNQNTVSPDTTVQASQPQTVATPNPSDTVTPSPSGENAAPLNPFATNSTDSVNVVQPATSTNTVNQAPPVAPMGSQGQAQHPSAGTGFAIVSLVLGVIAVIPPAPFIPFVNIISIVLGGAAIGFGIAHLRKLKKGIVAAGKGMAIAGIITGAVAVVLSVVVTGLTLSALTSIGTGTASSVEVTEYGNLDSDDVNDTINTTTTTKSAANEFLGGNPNCESSGDSSETCTYVGGNLEEGLVVVLDFDGDRVMGMQSSSSSFNVE